MSLQFELCFCLLHHKEAVECERFSSTFPSTLPEIRGGQTSPPPLIKSCFSFALTSLHVKSRPYFYLNSRASAICLNSLSLYLSHHPPPLLPLSACTTFTHLSHILYPPSAFSPTCSKHFLPSSSRSLPLSSISASHIKGK